MNPTTQCACSSYMTNFGQGGRMLEITPGRDCRLWPYVRAADCDRKINLCKSQAVYGLPPAAYQGLPVNYQDNLASDGTSCSKENYCTACGKTPNMRRENYAPNSTQPNYATLFPRCKRCTDSSRINGSGCRCTAYGTDKPSMCG